MSDPYFVGRMAVTVEPAEGEGAPEGAVNVTTERDGLWNIEGLANVLALMINEICDASEDKAVRVWMRARILELVCKFALKPPVMREISGSGHEEVITLPPKERMS